MRKQQMLDRPAKIIRPPQGMNVPGLSTHDLTFQSFRDQINPFLVISLFDMTGPVFPPHPHAGFSVATYIFPESDIGFWNQDTIGNTNQIAPGALHWTVAGKGLMHEETVTRSGRHALGFQIWIDHAADQRQIAPAGLHLGANEVPLIKTESAAKRVLVGASGEIASPLTVPTPVRLIDVELLAGAEISETLHPGENAFVWVRSGLVSLGAEKVGAGEATFVSGESFTAVGQSDARFTLFAARPINQLIQPGGPFVGSNNGEIAAFQANFRNGGMGRLTPFDQAKIDQSFDNPGIA
jgi:redox-sensitive bicupin YhaK (pirin superfamily)